MIYRFHRKSFISQHMTAQPKNPHISGKHVGQLFAGKCTDVIWECSKIQWFFLCDVFLQTLCFHRNDGLICRNLGCDFLWRAACCHTCFPLNSSRVRGCCSLRCEQPRNVTMQSYTNAFQCSRRHQFYLYTFLCTLGKYYHRSGPRERIFFFFLFLPLLLVLFFFSKAFPFFNVLTTFFNLLCQSMHLWMILLEYVILKIMMQGSLEYFYQEDQIISEVIKILKNKIKILKFARKSTIECIIFTQLITIRNAMFNHILLW